jgi:exodeoxyribonuclease V beta subunit
MTEPFDLCGELPQPGITILAASAGTGKTSTIAGLAARYVAEGIPLDRLLLVTFTILATSELRERVRERLVAVERALREDPSRDEVAQVLSVGDVGLHLRRLQAALADFDAATIATTHGFCLEMLSGLGVDGDLEPDHTFAEDVTDLVDEVVDDLYIRRFQKDGDPPFSRAQAGTIVRAATIANPVAPLEPRAAPPQGTPAMRKRLAEVARDELAARKRRMAVMTYDDLLHRLDGALDGVAAVERLQQRYAVVLVDEFQDTDPKQWSILTKAFGNGTTRLVLIGDPKQAIYAFRGADVFAYLDAARAAGVRRELRVNWRSDAALLRAYDALFGGARLGHAEIAYEPVNAAHAEPRYAGAPDPAALRFRVVHREDTGVTRGGAARKPEAAELIAEDLAHDVVSLLRSDATITDRPVAPRDVAVLVRSHFEASQIHDALTAVGVPAVINGAGSVFEAPAAREWLRLLEALERPSSPVRAHGVALTCFLGWTAEQVATADDAAWETVHGKLHDWARALRARGVAAMTEAITLGEGLPERVLATSDGERRLTDIRHLAQLLHASAAGESLGPTALAAWLRRRMEDARRDSANEERSRRLESDADAVQILTIHRSKGLEFGIVYYPFMWHGRKPGSGDPVVFHDGEERTLDVGLEGADYDDHVGRALMEDRGEDLRLVYVALTRAKHQAVVWWAGTQFGRDSALSRLLFCLGEDGTVPGQTQKLVSDAEAIERFRAIAAVAPGCVSVERAVVGGPVHYAPDLEADRPLAVRAFDRPALDRHWRRTSYSDITAGAHDARVASEPEEPQLADEPEAPETPAPEVADAVPLADIPVGLHVGTFIHRLLEKADFDAPDLEAELVARVEEGRAWRSTDVGDPVAGLAAALRTPLDAGGLRLCDVARADRLDELTFELPLAGGDEPTGELTLTAIAAALRAFGEPVPGYADRLADAALRRSVRGYLTGSIDLVVRTGDGRFVVADYKTNWLGATQADYAPEALATEMDRYHYALQALLYTVALHRYLRWRLPGYDPGTHLGGVRYLFLRGMTGTAGAGVFAWDPSPDLVLALSDVLDGGE